MSKAKKEKKKKRRSLTRQIIRINLLAHFVSLLVIIFITRYYMVNESVSELNDVTDVALEGACEVLNALDADFTDKLNPVVEARVHNHFKRICIGTEIDYLYLYAIEDDNTIRYIASAAEYDEEDAAVNELYGSGKVEKRELYDNEKAFQENNDLYARIEIVKNDFGVFYSRFLPIYDESGENMLIFRADYPIFNVVKPIVRKLVYYILLLLISLIVTMILSVVRIRHSVVRPVRALSKDMMLFTDKKEVVPLKSSGKFLNEITDIEGSFDTMQKEIKSYMDDIESLTREKVQTKTQLDIARRIQQGIVPEKKSYSRHNAYVYASSKPAIDVGGDFYDIFELDDRKLCIIEADVSGKGISAALFMMMMRSTIREKIKADKDPGKALSEVNADISKSNPELMFATVFVIILDTLTGEIVYCNAGHNPPVFISSKKVKYLEVDPNIAVGLFDDENFSCGRLTLKDKEGLYIYTDGITEAINTSDKQYTLQRVIEVIANNHSETPALTVKAVTDDLKEFTSGKEQFDDMTQIAILFKKDRESVIKLSPEIGEISRIKEQILKAVPDIDKAKQVILCCEEIFSNIINYSGAGDISLMISEEDEHIKITFTDDGAEFDPTTYEGGISDFEELDTGGMGIFMVKENCDMLSYKRDGDRNNLELLFKKQAENKPEEKI